MIMIKRKLKKQDPYRRVKVRLATVFDKNITKDQPWKIKTIVFTCDENGDPKETPETINCLDDLRKIFVWKSKVQFALEINKFWSTKNKEDGVRKCSMTIKCLQMFILERPEYNKAPSVLSRSVFGSVKKQDDKKQDNKKKKVAKEESEESNDKKSDKENDSDDENNDKSDKEDGNDNNKEDDEKIRQR